MPKQAVDLAEQLSSDHCSPAVVEQRNCKPVLISIGGLPGTGKTTVARTLATALRAAYVRIDSIETAIGRAEGRFEQTNGWELPPGYLVGYDVATDQLRNGVDVVAESVNPLRASRDGWRGVGLRAGARVVEVEVVCSDVDEHRRRAEERVLDVAGLTKPTWGCSREVITPLSPHQWVLTFDGKVSMRPSIGSWALPCQSHYVIARGEIRWVGSMSKDAIHANREADHRTLDEAHAADANWWRRLGRLIRRG